ncbi:MAG: 6,7-dimethyl-8-ribityllumazine synthase [Armatimonadetes bacterium CG2_30_59_28]|nr:6,7-dimethyl-8-ribityllumazine synthase [Armatimonadota bacterium]OIO97912.1 MAG: 6,7-dimethyl-8-ribityllumazine synthase [Armatimonadetes bacterium CG2_30_59_28]PIU65969.1 MAG: 6,7-dimethyl-8-ribityllumazine synthase [Armatimonadetes bacterium CG07_land_8_20_14_0_80_59_28]PIX38548.1 MAG: 6,7-dimethyl-8-ribityllumazine synthase [Armatimonadetes bacterium CG_4_8_14_3_um_filter_58_9]PIY48279.1 MAG: 6,7-dimethyl-8-ribityllumazine synthase [Armatimonadetes bacterium CG_4_10_14_3_um_filter_59_10]
MSKFYEGAFSTEGHHFAVIVSRFNELVTQRLLEGTLDAFRRQGVPDNEVETAWVPGTFEIPVVAKKLAATGRFHAIVALGTVIRGATPHFDYVAGEAAKGIAQVAMETGVPVIFGIVTADSLEQALERAGSKMGNRGFDAAISAIEMANLMGSIS